MNGNGNGNGNDDDKHDDTRDDKPTAEIIAWPKHAPTRPPAPRPELDAGPRDEAEALVIKALASITGREPADIIRDIRAREEEGAADDNDEPSNVVDLNAVREARQKAHTDTGLDLGEVFRTGFRAVMDELAQQRPAGGELVIDAGFVRENGTRILGNVLKSLSHVFLEGATPTPSRSEPAVETEPVAATDEAPTPPPADTPPGSTRPVEIRLDLGSIAMSLLDRFGLFRGPSATTSPKPETGPDTDNDPTT